ncbi:uncharacterized protein [Haliotis asinina]|uniref:uncharacterized protein n=1 Tax=Haliotis asinina TaxID=109174 RepID=UPI003532192A
MMEFCGDLPVWNYLTLTVVVLCCVSNASVVPNCPLPTPPVVVTKDNEHDLMIDSASYTSDTTSLPVKCVSEVFIPQDDMMAKCQNGTWKLPNTKCVPLITRERKVTNIIMAIVGAVGGVLAAAFIIVKIICYRRRLDKRLREQRWSKIGDDIEMTSDGRFPPESRNMPLQTARQSAHLYTQSLVSGRNSQYAQPTSKHDGRASKSLSYVC